MALEQIVRLKDATSENYYKHTLSWTLSEKSTHDLVLSSASYTVTFSHIDIVKAICITSTTDITVTISTASNSLAFGIEAGGVLLFNPTTTFTGTITSIVITESDGASASVDVRIYGASSS
jgi:hypothetical protein